MNVFSVHGTDAVKCSQYYVTDIGARIQDVRKAVVIQV